MAEMTHEDMWAKCQLLDKYLREKSAELAVLREQNLEMNAELVRIRPVYDAAVAWRELDSAHTRGTLLAAVTAAEGK